MWAAACVADRGLRGGLRRASPWVGLLVFAGLWQASSALFELRTGFAPYAHYGIVLEIFGTADAMHYGYRYPGLLVFLAEHGARVLRVIAWNGGEIARTLLVRPDYHYVGWLVVPACLHAWRRRDEERVARLFLAAFSVSLLALAVVSWGAIDPRRLVLPAAACFWLLAASLLAAMGHILAAGARRPAALAWGPALAVVVVWLLSPSASATMGASWRAWQRWRQHGTATGYEHSPYRPLSEHLEPGARVASPDPWVLHLVCGHAGRVVPPDLVDDEMRDRFLREVPIDHIIATGRLAQALDGAAGLAVRARAGDLVLYAVSRSAPPAAAAAMPPPMITTNVAAPPRRHSDPR